MTRKTEAIFRIALFHLLFFGISLLSLKAQQEEKPSLEELKKTAPRVYVDCASCDLDYIKTEIPYVNYVRERAEADVHVLVTTLRTGGGGYEYTLTFLGQNRFAGINDVQKYYSNRTDTEDETRRGLTETLKIGLANYVARTPISRRLTIDFQEEEKLAAPAVDRWKNWVFSLSSSSYLRGEKSHTYQSLYGSLSANRVTEEIKLNLTLSHSYHYDRFTYEDQESESSYKTTSFSGLAVKSLGEHWSAGGYLSITSSTYQNYKLHWSLAPAVEFNVFPYSQSTRRQLRFLYRLSFSTSCYYEVTLYDRTRESRLSQYLIISLVLREKWGTISSSLEGANYFHDFSKNHLTLFNILSLNLVKGLNAFAYGGASLIHDQIYLPKGEASLEEVLLRRKILATNYQCFFAVGLSYTFGSIFTNVVNPRFGSWGGGGMSVSIF